jgi:hypothetical protein
MAKKNKGFDELLSKYSKSGDRAKDLKDMLRVIDKNRVAIVRQAAAIMQIYIEKNIKNKPENVMNFFEAVVSMSYAEGYKKAKKDLTAN